MPEFTSPLVPYDIDPSEIPQTFTDCLTYVPLLMSRDIDFKDVYRATVQRSQVPARTPCVVDCRPAWCRESENRVIAFAMMDRGHLRWYGVIGPEQDPAELAGVRSYVPVSEVLHQCVRIGRLNGSWT